MPDIPTIEPGAIYAGDTVKWTKDHPDYPIADGWSYTYYLNGKGVKGSDYDYTADGTGLVTIPATDTVGIEPGRYALTGKATKSGETFTFYNAPLVVRANLETQPEGSDNRTHARRVLDALEAAIEGRASRTDLSYQVFGQRQVQHLTPEQLIQFRQFYLAEVQREEQAAAIARGENIGGLIVCRFGPSAR